MSSRWRYAVTFAGGLLVGALAAAAVVGTHWSRNFSSWHVLQIADQANVAREILLGNGPQLADRITANLPAYVQSIQKVQDEFGPAEGVEWALWAVSDVYEASGSAPPDELRTILDSLPARASCKRSSLSSSNDGATR